MEPAAVVTLIAVVLVILALVIYLVAVILELQKITAGQIGMSPVLAAAPGWTR